MSCNSYGYTIIGVRLDNKALKNAIKKEEEKTLTEKRGCSHYVPESSKFCQECGAERIIISAKEISQDELIGQIKINYNCRASTTENKDIFVTISENYIAKTEDINSHGSYASINIPTNEDMLILSSKLKEKLEPYGLWDDNNFKIWTVGYCSY